MPFEWIYRKCPPTICKNIVTQTTLTKPQLVWESVSMTDME